jgi:hypothetical protein
MVSIPRRRYALAASCLAAAVAVAGAFNTNGEWVNVLLNVRSNWLARWPQIIGIDLKRKDLAKTKTRTRVMTDENSIFSRKNPLDMESYTKFR